MIVKKAIAGVLTILSIAATTAGFALSMPQEQLVFKPSSIMDGHFYLDGGVSYAWLFLSDITTPISSLFPMAVGARTINGNWGGHFGAGYAFDRNYFIPVRIEALGVVRLEKHFDFPQVAPGTGFTGNARIQTSQLMLNIYYDIYSLGGESFIPYIGAGLGVEQTRTMFSVQNAAGTTLASFLTRTSTAPTWDAEFGCLFPFNDRLDLKGFVRASGLGRDKFYTSVGGIANNAFNVSGSLAVDLGLGVHYNFM